MLQMTDIFTRVGYSTTDDGTKIVQYTCQIPLTKPEAMTVRRTVLNNDLYKEHRDACREDYAKFEDGAYEEQQRFLDNLSE